MAGFKINQRQLIAELTASDPILKRVAEQTLKEAFFDPAVEQLKEEFAGHDVTREIAAGVNASNISNTLEATFHDNEKEDSPPNLTSFMGLIRTQFRYLNPLLSAWIPITRMVRK